MRYRSTGVPPAPKQNASLQRHLQNQEKLTTFPNNKRRRRTKTKTGSTPSLRRASRCCRPIGACVRGKNLDTSRTFIANAPLLRTDGFHSRASKLCGPPTSPKTSPAPWPPPPSQSDSDGEKSEGPSEVVVAGLADDDKACRARGGNPWRAAAEAAAAAPRPLGMEAFADIAAESPFLPLSCLTERKKQGGWV